MKCIKCKTVNVHNANYCKECAYKFSEKEQEAAEKWTFIGMLKRYEKFKKNIKFGWLLDHWAFKIGSVLGVLIIGISFMLTDGTSFKIKENDNYKVEYNEKLDEYYIYSKKESAALDLYIPNSVDSLIVKRFDGKDNLVISNEYKVTDSIELYGTTSENDYYILEAKYNEKDSDELKLFMYQEKDGE